MIFSRCRESVKKPSIFSFAASHRFGYPRHMWIAVIYLWGINSLTLLSFGFDKLRASRKKKRISERKLLWLAAVGGSPGAIIGRWIFSHKTRKRRFGFWLYAIVIVQIAFIYCLIELNAVQQISELI